MNASRMKSMKEKVIELFKDKDEKNLLINIGLAFGIKGISLFISFFSMPLYIKYFNNNEVLGFWYTVLAILNWIVIFDFGLGNGLRNSLTEALALGNVEKAKKYISSTYGILTLIVLPVCIVGVIILGLVDINSFFNIDPELISKNTMLISVVILFCGICLSFVLKTINYIIYAVQKSSINNFISLITSIIPLVFILFFKGNNIEVNLLALTIVHVLAVNIPLLFASGILFKSKILFGCMPSFKYFNINTAKGMFKFGVQFFLAQMFFMILTSTNEIIITKMFSAENVVEYSIYVRLFTVIGSLFMLVLTPIWSKVTKDLAEKKYYKIYRTNHFLYILSILAGVCEIVMVLCSQFVVNIWLQDEAIIIHYPTALIFAFYGMMYIFTAVLNTIANGMNDLRTQIVFYGIGVVLKIPVIYVLSCYVLNWNVVVLYNGIVFFIFCIFQMIWIERKLKQLISK